MARVEQETGDYEAHICMGTAMRIAALGTMILTLF